MTVQRLDDWRARFREYIGNVAGRRFQPGTNDCALFAAGAVEAITGVDFVADFRGYKTLRQGRESLRQSGYEDHVALVASLLPELEFPVMAQVGDIAVVDTDGEAKALGVVQGPKIYVLRLDGLGTVSLTQAKRAFAV